MIKFLVSNYFPCEYSVGHLSRPVRDSSPITDMLRAAVVLFTMLTIHSAFADPRVNILLSFSKIGINQT